MIHKVIDSSWVNWAGMVDSIKRALWLSSKVVREGGPTKLRKTKVSKALILDFKNY